MHGTCDVLVRRRRICLRGYGWPATHHCVLRMLSARPSVSAWPSASMTQALSGSRTIVAPSRPWQRLRLRHFRESPDGRSVAPMAATLRASSRASARPDSKSSASVTVIFAGVSKSSAAEIPAGVPVAPEHSPASASSRHSPSSSGQGTCAGRLTRVGAGVGGASPHRSRRLRRSSRLRFCAHSFWACAWELSHMGSPGCPLASSTVIFPLLATRATSRALIVSRSFSGAGGSVMEKGMHGSELRVRVLLALVACGDRGRPPVPPGGGRDAAGVELRL